MDPRTTWVIIAALAVIGFVAWWYFRQQRTSALKHRFGPEYDRLVEEKGKPSRAERELKARTRRVEKLAIRPLAPAQRDHYCELWKEQQARFVDEPKAAIDKADHLVEEVMKERGYPVGTFDQRVADISVDHPQVIDNYRAAHEIAELERLGQATTEDLRRAMVHYRNLFLELLEDPRPQGVPAR